MKTLLVGKNINLREIEIDDAQFVLNLRTNPNKSKYLHKTDNNLDEQVSYIKRYYGKDDEWYFIIENKDHCPLGTIRIYDVHGDDFCAGSWLIVDDAPVTTGLESVLLLYDFAFNELGFNKMHIDVRKKNTKVWRFHEAMGLRRVAENDLDYFYSYSKEEFLKVYHLFHN